MVDTLAALNLRNAEEVQTLNLLHQILLTYTADELFRASNRAEGFVLGVETVKGAERGEYGRLVNTFEASATACRQEHEQ
ncbi:hypothetical protein FHG55_05125 [Pseudomonas jessenii]|uniref:Uncharacterized protein n=1 Tax=Pseudomonas jessenii TaxID=77298 RepID=A0A5C4L1P3_PSEJE|nr:hypothetical protein [Pseudomonas jessenii]TNB98435.1 hypothetical protein FHG55_05125 [Pseudomonas jessenii]